MAAGRLEEASSSTGRERRGEAPAPRRAVWLLLLVALTTLVSLPTRELMPTDEPRFALVARQMVEDPAPIVPHLGYDALTRQGELYADKPPVFFWLVSLFSFATGGVNEISSRLPSLLAAMATVLLTWRLGRLLFDEPTGFLGAALLATTSQFFLRAAWCSIDMTLTAFTTAAAFCWLAAARAAERRMTRLAALGGLFAAAATLSKGPVGIIFPVVLFISDRLSARFGVRREAAGAAAGTAPAGDSRPWRTALVAGLSAVILPVLAWIAAIGSIAGTPYVVEILFKQNVTRYVAAWNNIAPWYYYFGRLPVGLLPWLLLLPGALVTARAATRERGRAARGLLLASGALFVFFSLSTGKRGVYLLPLYPVLALLLASGWRLALAPRAEGEAAAPGWVRGFTAAHVSVFLIGGILAPVALPVVAHRRAPELVAGAVCLGVLAAAAGIAGFVLYRRSTGDSALLAHVAGVAVLVCAGSLLLVPAANRKAGVRDFGGELAALFRPDDFLVVDQEGYEQVLFYSRLRGARRDFEDTRIAHEGGALVVETGRRSMSQDPGGRRRPQDPNEKRASFAGELERAHRRVEFPPGARVLFVTTAPRAERVRAQIGTSARVILASRIYGKPYVVIASR